MYKATQVTPNPLSSTSRKGEKTRERQSTCRPKANVERATREAESDLEEHVADICGPLAPNLNYLCVLLKNVDPHSEISLWCSIVLAPPEAQSRS